MDTTVMVGDHLLVDKLSYAPAGSFARYILPYTDPKRGDIIVFRYPMDISQNYVKRVMGVPGDHIRVVDKVVYLNGKPLQEPYAQHIFPNFEPYRDNFPGEPRGPVYDRAKQMLAEHVENGELVVPPESYFAMGDNRDNSLDSRYWGFVPRENIIGKPLLIFWSYDAPTADLVGYSADHFLDLAKNFFFKTRWDRELKLVRGYPIQ
jgi:signal peptidase I